MFGGGELILAERTCCGLALEGGTVARVNVTDSFMNATLTNYICAL